MTIRNFLDFMPDMQPIEIIQKGKTIFDGFAYELYDHSLETSLVIRIFTVRNVLKLAID